MYESWSDISKAVQSVIAADGRKFDEATITNTGLFVAFAKDRWNIPDKVGLGYWPTINLSWSLEPAPVAVEIHADGYEFYQFFDGRTDIREFKPDQLTEFPAELAMLLTSLIAMRAT